VDEFGFDRIECEECPQAAHLLYKVIARRHQKRSTILITNVDFDAWAPYLGDAPLAMAMLDRLVETARSSSESEDGPTAPTDREEPPPRSPSLSRPSLNRYTGPMLAAEMDQFLTGGDTPRGLDGAHSPFQLSCRAVRMACRIALTSVSGSRMSSVTVTKGTPLDHAARCSGETSRP
jgi:hypothetical protein